MLDDIDICDKCDNMKVEVLVPVVVHIDVIEHWCQHCISIWKPVLLFKKPDTFQFNCNGCGKLLTSPGALVFSPPLRDNPDKVEKFHICVNCWFKLKDFIGFS